MKLELFQRVIQVLLHSYTSYIEIIVCVANFCRQKKRSPSFSYFFQLFESGS